MADTTLTSEELDALNAGVSSGEIEVDTGLNVHANVVKHDLTAEDSTLGINLSAIDMVNERFVRMFRLGLLEVLRTSPRVNLTKAKIVKFGEYLPDLKPPLSVTTIRANPLVMVVCLSQNMEKAIISTAVIPGLENCRLEYLALFDYLRI